MELSKLNKAAFLISGLSGYMNSCFRELRKKTACELLVCHWPSLSEAPFDDALFKAIDHRYQKNDISVEELERIVLEFQPDCIYISGWMDKDYLRVAKEARKRGIPVIAGCDTQWTGSLRQYIATWSSSHYLHPSIDALWVSGERQREFARRLGYTGQNCLEGVYACDWEAMASLDSENMPDRENAFLYVGRLMERKGTVVLLEAYALYRSSASNPWPLRIVGTGPMKDLLQKRDGVEDLGFIQPEQLPEVYRKASCFIMPSLYEPWGVAMQEAGANRMPLICTTACGAAVHLLRDYYNGFKVEPNDIDGLTKAMVSISDASPADLIAMGDHSYELAKQYTPEIWVDTLMGYLSQFQ